MHPESSMIPVTPQPPMLNSLQVLWLKELGIEQLWGDSLQASTASILIAEPAASSAPPALRVAQASDSAASPHTQITSPSQLSAQTVSPVSVQAASDGRSGSVPSGTGVSSGQDGLPQSDASTQQATRASIGASQSLGMPVGTDKPSTQAQKNNPLTRILENISVQQKQSKSRRLQRNESIRQADRPQVEGLDWAQLAEQVQSCQACPLHEERTHAVFGELGSQAALMIIDEMPGKEDDLSGHLFDSRSGVLLDNMLSAIGLGRLDVVLTSLLKCRSADGAPSELSLAQCQHYLLAQIQLIQPRCILVLGRAAFSFLQQAPGPFEHLREQTWRYTMAQGQEIPVVVSYHPSYLMAHQEDKALAWQDLKRVAKALAA